MLLVAGLGQLVQYHGFGGAPTLFSPEHSSISNKPSERCLEDLVCHRPCAYHHDADVAHFLPQGESLHYPMTGLAC